MPLPSKDNIVSKKSTKDIVYTELLELIINGTLKPGEKLVETELTDYFGVSRTPIREALQLLKEVKLVSIIPGQYTIVEPIDIQEMDNCYLVLANLQVLAIEQSFNNIKNNDIKNLKDISDNFNIAIHNSDIKNIVEYDNKFHSYIVYLTNNSYLIDIINMLQLHVTRLKYYYFLENNMREFSTTEHCQILDSLENKNLELAKNMMNDHWQRVRKTSLDIANYKFIK